MKYEHITSQQALQAAGFQGLHRKDVGQDDRNLLSLFHVRRDMCNKTQERNLELKHIYMIICNIYIYIYVYVYCISRDI